MGGPTPHLPAGSTADAPYSVVITPASAGWGWSGLRVLDLPAGGEHSLHTGDAETLVVPLSGSCTVLTGEHAFELTGRASVFSRVTDFAYVPRDAELTVASRDGGRFALPSALCQHVLPARYGAAQRVPVELRGAGSASRQVNNICTPESFEADRLMVVEVITPAGNWSSWPPHKHDEQRAGEVELEEIYYFEVEAEGLGPSSAERSSTPLGGSAGGAAARGLAYQRVYGTAERPIDVLAEVGAGDVVLVPHGWHGPSMAAPGYHLYYLNVMAGPGAERAWRVCDDPVHAWVRDSWRGQTVDPRLPLTSTEEQPR